MKDVDVHLFRLNLVKARRRVTPHLFQLKTFWLKQRVHQIEHIKPNSTTVDLGKNIADFVYFEILVQLDVGDLILARDALEVFTKGCGIVSMILSKLRSVLIASLLSFYQLWFSKMPRIPVPNWAAPSPWHQ